MTTLAEFQRHTVELALDRLTASGPRRFLVADEVGLGKTIIARAVAEGLRRLLRRLNVMYLCPSLEIVGQNRLKFISLTGIDEKAYRPGEDRLALVPREPPQEGNGYRIFTFTPETSLPGWKPGPRTGRKAERVLIRTVLDRYPTLRQKILSLDHVRSASRRPLFGERASGLDGYTYAGIDRALREVFACPEGSVEEAIIAWLDKRDLMEFVARSRSALALAALRLGAVRPDLLILDEFHRYADLILPRKDVSEKDIERERARVHQLLVDALLGGERPPAVLLLSATPYRLRRLGGQDIHPAEHYRALIDLAGFLSNDPGCRAAVEAALQDYHNALKTPGSPEAIRAAVLAEKESLETLLGPIMARTERALVHKEDLFERKHRSVEIEADDLIIFRHFAQNCGSSFAGWAPGMWSSIPYPAQTLHGYKLWEGLKAAQASPIEAGSGRGRRAHPQLRALTDITGGTQHLALPWQPPTVPWWRLGGPWSSKKAIPGKTLLFSKWRAAPTAISALFAIDVAHGLREPKSKAQPPLLRPGGRGSGALIAMFTPWPSLSHAIEPMKLAASLVRSARLNAEDQLETYLVARGISLDGKEKRPTWIIACGIERHLSARDFSRLATVVAKASTGAGSDSWSRIGPIASISRSELTALAGHLLSAPGSIVSRCARRHAVPQNSRSELERIFDFAWNGLRGYLGHRAFAKLILGSSTEGRYPDALCGAMLKGGFEAVLDEQMGLLGQLGDARGLEIVDQLRKCLLDRPGLVRFRRGKTDHRVPVQAATPFSGAEQRRTGAGKRGKLRSDTLRRAFNSPFWPHVLCTTSIGQEGLDFHLWCRRIVHWDLPTDPVDFEQREGRIARYASLAVRQALAGVHSVDALSRSGNQSPFSCLLEIAREQPAGETGLERWWLPASGPPQSVTFNWPFSQKSEYMKRLSEELLYYRLALGQPDPDAFREMLCRVGASEADARGLAIDLSAISRVDRHNEAI